MATAHITNGEIPRTIRTKNKGTGEKNWTRPNEENNLREFNTLKTHQRQEKQIKTEKHPWKQFAYRCKYK